MITWQLQVALAGNETGIVGRGIWTGALL